MFFFLSFLFVSSGDSGPAGNLEDGKPPSLRDAAEDGVRCARGVCEGTETGRGERCVSPPWEQQESLHRPLKMLGRAW